jgi:16S rRNA G966 N2-methylase RsmD
LWYAEAGIFYPLHLALEQASSELTARYKASLVRDGNGTFADLTGGMGVDFSFLSPHFREAVYVERNEDLCRIAAHNFRLLGLKNVTLHCADAESFLRETVPLDFIYLDPSRRDNAGRKVFRIEDCSPDLSEIKPLLLEKSGTAMVKYSPMLDISLALKSLDCVSAVHVVSVDNECKELLFLLSKTAVNEPLFVAVNLKRSGREERFTFTPEQEQKAVFPFAGEPGRYLYEPNASILKAGAFKSVAQAYNLQKLHINSHLYTSDERVADFPGRVFEVESFFLPNKQNLKTFLQCTKKANITVRNYPAPVAGIRHKTGLKDGGDVYLFATTLAGERKVWIVCRKASYFSCYPSSVKE